MLSYLLKSTLSNIICLYYRYREDEPRYKEDEQKYKEAKYRGEHDKYLEETYSREDRSRR